MGELINGRTPEEIKDALKHCIEPVPYGCEVCPYLGIDIDEAVRRKMEINRSRPWKHGKETECNT